MNLEHLLKKAMSKQKAGKFVEARNYYLKILKQKKDHLDALYLLGTLYGEHKKMSEAIRYLEKASQLKPDSPMIQNNLGNIYRMKGDFPRAKEYYMRALALNPDLPQANYNLGLILDERFGETNEALKYYHKAFSVDPTNAGAYQGYGNLLVNRRNPEGLKYLERAGQLKPDRENLQSQIGRAYLVFGKKSEAIASLRIALKQDPENMEAKYYLSIAEGRLPDKKSRTEYVKEVFDGYAPRFEDHLVKALEYKIPMVAREIIERIYGNDISFENMADLGCGTGLSGIAFRGCAKNIVGIDLSREMLDIASDKGVYDILLQGDIIEVLDGLDKEFDFFLAADVIIYFQELDDLFAAIRKKAAPGALFVFSTERHEGNSFAVSDKTGRTAHSVNYIHSLTENFNFRIVEETRLPIRKENDIWIEGELYILKST